MEGRSRVLAMNELVVPACFAASAQRLLAGNKSDEYSMEAQILVERPGKAVAVKHRPDLSEMPYARAGVPSPLS